MDMNNNKKNMSILLFLPSEISANIFCRLPIASIKQCKLVCNTWRALIEDPVFIDTYTNHLLQFHDDGSVVTSVGILLHTQSYDKADKELLQFAEYNDDDDDDKLMPRFKVYKESKPIDPQLPYMKFLHRYFLGSCNGLVCFRSTDLSSNSNPIEDVCTQVCNPFTREYVTLPTLSLANSFSYIASGFGYHPSTKEYKVVRIVYFKDDQRSMGYVFVYTLGSDTGCWRQKGETKHRLCSSSSSDNKSIGYNVGGVLHWLNENMEIISFDLAVEEFRTLPSPPSIWGGCSYDLGVLGGCLCMSLTKEDCSGKTIFSTWVMLMNKESKEYSWIKKFSMPCWKTCDYVPRDYVPLAILKSGRILLRYNRKNIDCYDPKTKRLVPTECCFSNDQQQAEIIPYMRSFVSLKSMGEKV